MPPRAVAVLSCALAVLIAAPASSPARAQDVAAGAALFGEQCANCHSTVAGDNGTGPSLRGVAGAPAAQVAGFAFSAAMQGSGKTWNDATLDAYLTNPKRAVPGTKMNLGGVPDPDDRASLIAYLKTLH